MFEPLFCDLSEKSDLSEKGQSFICIRMTASIIEKIRFHQDDFTIFDREFMNRDAVEFKMLSKMQRCLSLTEISC